MTFRAFSRHLRLRFRKFSSFRMQSTPPHSMHACTHAHTFSNGHLSFDDYVDKRKINKSRKKVLISCRLSHRRFSELSPICTFAFVTDDVFDSSIAFFGKHMQYSHSPLTRRNLSSITEDQSDRVYCIFLWNIKLTLS